MSRRIIVAMMMMTVAVSMNSCKDEAPEAVSPIPAIEFISISPNPAAEFVDEVAITISYIDGDGDLGENNAEVENIVVKDSRNQLEYKFRVKQLAPDDTEIVIQGELDIVLDNVNILESSAVEEKVIYDVFVTDRAGNVSNTITTAELIITR